MRKGVLVVLAVLAVATAARADEVVTLAYIDPLSGSMAATGRLGEQHFRFAIDRVNARDGAGPGRRLELVALDNEVSPATSLKLLQKAIDRGVHYVAQGHGSAVALALSDAIAKNNRRAPKQAVVFLNYAAIDPALTNKNCNWWHFRFDADSDMKMLGLTDHLISQTRVKKVYLFNPDDPLGRSLEHAAIEMLGHRRKDMEIVGAERVAPGTVKDFAPHIQKIQAAGADTVVTGSAGADLYLLADAAAASGYKGTFYTYDLGEPDVIAHLGTAGRGYAQISEYHANVDAVRDAAALAEMAAAFESQYHQPFYFWRVVEAVEMWAAAMKQANSSDPAKVGAALAGMTWKGALGDVTMRADNHQLLQPLFVSVLEPGTKTVFPSDAMGFSTVRRIEAQSQHLPTTCRFSPPGRQH